MNMWFLFRPLLWLSFFVRWKFSRFGRSLSMVCVCVFGIVRPLIDSHRSLNNSDDDIYLRCACQVIDKMKFKSCDGVRQRIRTNWQYEMHPIDLSLLSKQHSVGSDFFRMHVVLTCNINLSVDDRYIKRSKCRRKNKNNRILILTWFLSFTPYQACNRSHSASFDKCE